MRGTGTLYLSRTEGPGDFTSLIDSHAWLFEYGFYVAGQYHFLRETPNAFERLRPLAGGYGVLLIIIGLILATFGVTEGLRLVGFCLVVPGAVLWAWGRQ